MYYYFDVAEKMFGIGVKRKEKKQAPTKTKIEKIIDMAETLHISPNIANNIYNKCEYYGNNGIEVNPRKEADIEIDFARYYG